LRLAVVVFTLFDEFVFHWRVMLICNIL
jgi:hypothetical protein